MNKKYRLAPSILSADFSKLGQDIKQVEELGVDILHIDVMDGNFVPNISLGPPVIKSIRKVSKSTFDVHLMISNPEKYIDEFVAAGADILTVHVEATSHLHSLIMQIKQAGIMAGVTLNPATPLEMIRPILPYVDLVLVMSVNPGFGGQTFIEASLDRLKRLKQIREENGFKYLIEIDGGVKHDNAKKIIEAGADIIVAGSAVFETSDRQVAVKGFMELFD